MPRKKKVTRRRKVAPRSAGLDAREAIGQVSPRAQEAASAVQASGGSILGAYRDPFGGRDLILAVLPIDLVEPTPYQRDVSETHVRRLMTAIEKTGSFLDPIIAIPHGETYWTPNGNHRLQAMKRLGAKSITAILIPDPDVVYKILALNTEKAHNLREKSLEVVRMLRALAMQNAGSEHDFAFEFEEPAYLTLGLCYESKPKFSGGAYQALLRRLDDFLDLPLKDALPERMRRAQMVINLDEQVGEVVARLKEKGLVSPYLKSFIVARIDPTRFSKATEFDFDRVLEKMTASAQRFNVEKVSPEDLARSGGAAEMEE